MNFEWKISNNFVDYQEAVDVMEKRVADILANNNNSKNLIWFLRHNSLYTAGVSAKNEELINPDSIPIYKTNRGGKYTYHGPGIGIIYFAINLKELFSSNPDVRKFVEMLEGWVIKILASYNIKGKISRDRIGVWVFDKNDNQEKKIAAIGIKIRKWIAYHGIAINIDPDLNYFNGIIPCGIKDFGVTSMKEQGVYINFSKITKRAQKIIANELALTDQN